MQVSMFFLYTFSIIVCTFFLIWEANGNPVETSETGSILVEPTDVAPSASLDHRSFAIKPGNPSVGLPWPNNQLRYCFEDKPGTEAALGPIVNQAWTLWRNAGVRSLTKVKVGCKDGVNNYYPLIIKRNNERRLSTTMGVQIGRDYYGNSPNTLTFDETHVGSLGFKNNFLNMAHELGHSMGLHHEHQRADAPEHVRFHCENLEDYDERKKAGYNMDRLCTNRREAEGAKFLAFDFIAIRPADDRMTQDDPYDPKSIMHYGTYFGSKKRTGTFPWERKRVLSDLHNKDLPDQATRPSQQDVTRVNQLYP